MKYFFFLALIILLSSKVGLQAQEKQWEVGWQLYNSNATPGGIIFNQRAQTSFLNGILVKHRSPSFKQRFGIQYLSVVDKEASNFCCDRILSNGLYEGVEITLGIEKAANYGILEYYFMFDLGLGMGQFQGDSGGGFVSFLETFDLRYRSIGAYPGGGLSIWIKERISLNWEVRWPGVFYKTRGAYNGNFDGPRAPNEGLIWQDRPESFLQMLIAF